jgi:hypothetical protein
MHIEDSEAHWLGASVLIDNLLTNDPRDRNLRAPFHVRDLSKVSAAESSSCGAHRRPIARPLTALSAGQADLADGGDVRASGGTLDRPMDNRVRGVRATARSCHRASGT